MPAFRSIMGPGGPMLVPYDDQPDPNQQAIAQQAAEREAQAQALRDAEAQTLAEAEAAPDLYTASPESLAAAGLREVPPTGGIVDPFAGSPPPAGTPGQALDALSAGASRTAGAFVPDRPPAMPTPAATGTPGQALDAIAAGAGKVAGAFVPDPAAPPAPPAPAPPEPAPASETPEEEEARLVSQWSKLAAIDLAPLNDKDRTPIIEEQGKIADRLKQIYGTRGVEAQQAVANEQARIQAEAQKAADEAARAAVQRKAEIDADHQAKMAHVDKLDAEATNAKIDRSWSTGGTGNAIMLAISLAMAGLGSALKGQGDKNPALDIVLKNVDQRVADQWGKKKEVHEWATGQRDRLDVYHKDSTLSVEQAQAAARVNLLKEASERIKNVAGTLPAAQRAALDQLAGDAMAEAMKHRADLDKTIYDRAVKDREDAEKNRSALAQEKTARAAVGVQAGRLKLDRDQFNEGNIRYYAPETVDARRLDRAKTQAEIDKLMAEASASKDGNTVKALEAQKKALELEEAKDNQTIQAIRPSVVTDPKTNLPVIKDGKIVVSYGTLKQPDGQTAVKLKGTEDGRFKVADAVAAYEAAAKATDALVNEVAEHGWSSTTLKGDNYKRAQALYTALLLEGKDTYGLGALQPAEIKMMGGLFGGDPTAFIGDPIVSLRAARSLLGEKAYTRFKAHSDYSGTYDDFALPEDTKYGIREGVKNTPAESLVQRAEGRVGSKGSLNDAEIRDVVADWSRDPGAAAGPALGATPDTRGVPSRDAYDAIQEAADNAVGRGKGDPAAGRNALAAIIRTENHGPAWQLAARMAFENDIDLGIDYFNPQAYAAARNSGSVEVMRTLYGTDPTYGYGGTAAKRADRQQAAGVTEADRSGFFDMLRKVR